MASGNNYTGKMGISSGGATTWDEARRLDMHAFDRLPPLVQAALMANITNLSCVSVLRFFQASASRIGSNGAEQATVRKLAELEAGELSVFAGGFKAAWRVPLPHVAAQVSILRYGPVSSKRRGRRSPRIRGFGLADTEAA